MTAATPITPAQGASRFEDVLVTRTLRAIEDSGPLEDASELREAARQATTRDGQAIARARALGRRIGLIRDLERIRSLARLVVPLTALGVVLLTWVLVGSVLGEGRRINVVLAWLGVLGPSTAGLLVWAAAVLAPRSPGLGTLAEGLGGLALRACSRPALAGSHAPALVQEGVALVREARLLPWAFGVLNHGIWALSFVALVGLLYVMFAARAYQLTWESTILEQPAFLRFVAATGRPAQLLGLPHADVRSVAPGEASANLRLAFWLMYCVLFYGFLPRLLLALWSWRKWTRSMARIPLDLADPYFRRLFQRLDQLAAPVVVDAEPDRAAPSAAAATGRPAEPTGAPVWIAFELPTAFAWRAGDGFAQLDVAGDSEGRHQLIDRLVRAAPARAVVVCNGASSPDRGTARFLRDVAGRVGAMAVLLVLPEPAAPSRAAVWTTWLQASGLGATPVFDDPRPARDWQTSTAGAT